MFMKILFECYEQPQVAVVDVVVEQGFALSNEMVDDNEGEW